MRCILDFEQKFPLLLARKTEQSAELSYVPRGNGASLTVLLIRLSSCIESMTSKGARIQASGHLIGPDIPPPETFSLPRRHLSADLGIFIVEIKPTPNAPYLFLSSARLQLKAKVDELHKTVGKLASPFFDGRWQKLLQIPATSLNSRMRFSRLSRQLFTNKLTSETFLTPVILSTESSIHSSIAESTSEQFHHVTASLESYCHIQDEHGKSIVSIYISCAIMKTQRI